MKGSPPTHGFPMPLLKRSSATFSAGRYSTLPAASVSTGHNSAATNMNNIDFPNMLIVRTIHDNFLRRIMCSSFNLFSPQDKRQLHLYRNDRRYIRVCNCLKDVYVMNLSNHTPIVSQPPGMGPEYFHQALFLLRRQRLKLPASFRQSPHLSGPGAAHDD